MLVGPQELRLREVAGVGPVRRVVRPVQLGGVSLDLAVTLVFVAVVVLRQLELVA